MDARDLKDGLTALHDHLGELETAARKLPNQNFADIIKSARGRLHQASEHPDIEAAGEQFKADHEDKNQERFPFDPDPQAGSAGKPYDPSAKRPNGSLG